MSKDDRIIPSGPFKGKKIEVASTEVVDMFQSLAEEFMEAIFEMEPGSYLITDESCLRDFKGVGAMHLSEIYGRIQSAFAVDVNDMPSDNLADIFTRIHRQRYGSGK